MPLSHWKQLSVPVIVLMVAACGGGGGGGTSSGAASGPQSQVAASGTITGFGSVIVNGVHYDESRAEIKLDDSINGNIGGKDDLRVGMVVDIEGSLEADGSSKATRIAFENRVRGFIESINAAAGTFKVMGQTVVVGGRTVFEHKDTLATLKVGDAVAVSGHEGSPDANGNRPILATRIEKKPAGFSGVLKVKGVVSKHNKAARTFQINELLVNYGGAQPGGLSELVKDGMIVDAKGSTPPVPLAGGTFHPELVVAKSAGMNVAEGVRIEVEGYISDYVSAADFKVNGVPVDASAAGLTGLKNGVRVELKGTMVNGKLVVRDSQHGHAEDDSDSKSELKGQVSRVDATDGSIMVAGKLLIVSSTTVFKDEEREDRFFALKSIRVGDYVEVSAYQNKNGQWVATKVERKVPESGDRD